MGIALAGVGEAGCWDPGHGDLEIRKSGNQGNHMGGSVARSSGDTQGIPIKSIH